MARYHLQAVVVGEERGAFFQRVLRRDDNPHLVDSFMLQHGVGDDEVPDVDRIEGPEKKSGALH